MVTTADGRAGGSRNPPDIVLCIHGGRIKLYRHPICTMVRLITVPALEVSRGIQEVRLGEGEASGSGPDGAGGLLRGDEHGLQPGDLASAGLLKTDTCT